MSETTERVGADAGTPATGPDVETRARQMGWKPREEYRGPDGAWLPADQFLERGFESPAVMADRLHVMGDRMARMERDNRSVTTKLDEAIGTINTMTNMARSAERRAYERARRDLESEREKAVETGDTATFKRLDNEIRDLDKTAPEPPAAAPPVPTQPQQGQPHPAVMEFYRRNPWYGKDAAMTQEADLVHTGLLNTRRDLTMEQNLAEVERRIRTAFPGNGAQPQRQETTQEDNPRRQEAGAVSPASQGAQRQRPNRRSFAAMPDESKQAYRRYKTMLQGKGEPLTEDEWATDYWSQFEDDGT